RNCPWNKCAFCPAYKGEKFSIRSLDEIVAEITQVSSEPGSETIKHVFLQDADAIIMPCDRLVQVLRFIRQKLPGVERITAYARSSTLARRKMSDLKDLQEAGLSRVHVGLESGCDEVLQFVRKGVTAATQLDGCQRVREAGLELCCYVMPGLGGRKLSEQHARETGRLIAAIKPNHVRLRTCFVLQGTPLAEAYTKGLFEPIGDEEIVREIRIFLSIIADTQTELISDHRMNLLLELRGVLPRDHDQLMRIVDHFLELGSEEKKLFIIGRRLGLLQRLDELSDEETRMRIKTESYRYSSALPVTKNVLY
ncbi:MAG TPA: radical SAM protein, partial [Nitrospirota bacterium]|nr:radical SAM protein [Nitrospirota bacterium]